MVNRFVVSTECPTCGAPLDFDEGSHAIRCGHCRSNLLVTGRKQVLTYYVRPKVDKHRAVSAATVAQRKEGERWRAVKRHLYFIPYYRFTGHAFNWERASSQTKPTAADFLASTPSESLTLGGEYGADQTFDSAIEAGINYLFRAFKGRSGARRPKKTLTIVNNLPEYQTRETVKPALYAVKTKEKESVLFAENEEIQFRDRHVDKSFVACDLDRLGLYSLGVRPGVLRLELFRKEALEALGTIVSVGTSPDKALSHGMKSGDRYNLIFRQVIGRVLSVIYFPFWVVEMQHRGEVRLTIVDAVSESVVKLDASSSLYATLDHKVTSIPAVVGFRPLTCPNCGWDLPMEPHNVIFFCSSCQKTWQIGGSELSQVPYEIAERPSPKNQEPVKYLPFWVIQSELERRPFRFFLPAFRYRRLKFLNDLATKIGRVQPSYSVLTGEAPELHGCYYDQEDATMLAEFVYAGWDSEGAKSVRESGEKKLKISAITLAWFPFEEKGYSLRDPFLGLPLPKNLLS